MRVVRIIAWASAALAALLAAAALVLWLGGTALAARVVVNIAAAKGWHLEYGAASLRWGDPIRLVVEDLHLSRIAAPNSIDLRAARLEAELERSSFLRLSPRARRLTLEQPLLAIDSDGSLTAWDGDLVFLADARELAILAGRLEYRNGTTGAKATLDIAELQTDATPQEDGFLRLRGRGIFQGKPIAVEKAEVARDLLAGGGPHHPLPLALEGSLGPNRIVLRGGAKALRNFEGLDLKVEMAGDDIQQVLDALAVPMPRLPIYQLAGRLQHDDGRWRLDDMTGWIGGSSIAGSMVVDSAGALPAIHADLKSAEMDLADLRGFYGGEPGARANRQAPAAGLANHRVIPDFEVPMERLNGFTAEVSLDAAHVRPPAGWGIERVGFAVSVKDGGLRIEHLRVATAGGGSLAGEAELRPGRDPELQLRLDARSVALQPLFMKAQVPARLKELEGVFSGSVRLRSTGATERRLSEGLEGEGELVLQNGKLTRRMAGIVEGDVADAFEVMLGGKPADRLASEGRFNCIVGKLEVKDGVATAMPLILETPETIVLGSGNVNLADETVTFDIRPYAKDRSRRPIGVPLRVRGPFAEVQIDADKSGLAARVGAALGFGALQVSPELKALLSSGVGGATCIAALAGSDGAESSH
jgi:hypothetical protein